MRAIKISRKTKNIEGLIKKIQTLVKSKVESGYFSEQGEHYTYDSKGNLKVSMPYVDLIAMQEYGTTSQGGNIPARPIRDTTLLYLKNPMKSYAKALSGYFYGNTDLRKTLDIGGQVIGLTAQNLFGIAIGKIEGNARSTIEIKGFDAPLVDSGDLMEKWAYKTSSNPNLRYTM